METNAATAAIATGDVDAAIGGSQWLGLRDQGVARVIYRTTGGDPKYTANTTFLGSSRFIQEYPEHTLQLGLTGYWAPRDETGKPRI